MSLSVKLMPLLLCSAYTSSLPSSLLTRHDTVALPTTVLYTPINHRGRIVTPCQGQSELMEHQAGAATAGGGGSSSISRLLEEEGPSAMLELLQKEASSVALAYCCPYFTTQARALLQRQKATQGDDGGGAEGEELECIMPELVATVAEAMQPVWQRVKKDMAMAAQDHRPGSNSRAEDREGLHRALELLKELSRWGVGREALMRGEGSDTGGGKKASKRKSLEGVVVVTDLMARAPGGVLASDVMGLVRVLTVGEEWRAALGATGVIELCLARMRKADKLGSGGLVAEGVALLHGLCFDEDNVARLLRAPGGVADVAKAMRGRDGDAALACHGVGILYFLALDLMQQQQETPQASGGGEQDDQEGAGSRQQGTGPSTLPPMADLIDAVLNALHNHSSDGKLLRPSSSSPSPPSSSSSSPALSREETEALEAELVVAALGFLRTLALNKDRLLEVTGRVDLSMLVGLLETMLREGDDEGTSDAIEIILRILMDEDCCMLALIGGEDGSSNHPNMRPVLAHLRAILGGQVAVASPMEEGDGLLMRAQELHKILGSLLGDDDEEEVEVEEEDMDGLVVLGRRGGGGGGGGGDYMTQEEEEQQLYSPQGHHHQQQQSNSRHHHQQHHQQQHQQPPEEEEVEEQGVGGHGHGDVVLSRMEVLSLAQENERLRQERDRALGHLQKALVSGSSSSSTTRDSRSSRTGAGGEMRGPHHHHHHHHHHQQQQQWANNNSNNNIITGNNKGGSGSGNKNSSNVNTSGGKAKRTMTTAAGGTKRREEEEEEEQVVERLRRVSEGVVATFLLPSTQAGGGGKNAQAQDPATAAVTGSSGGGGGKQQRVAVGKGKAGVKTTTTRRRQQQTPAEKAAQEEQERREEEERLKARICGDPQRVAEEVAKNLRLCFVRILRTSNFRAGRRYTRNAAKQDEWVIGHRDLRRFVKRCGMLSKKEDEEGEGRWEATTGRKKMELPPQLEPIMTLASRRFAGPGVPFHAFCEVMMVLAKEYHSDEAPVMAVALLAKALHSHLLDLQHKEEEGEGMKEATSATERPQHRTGASSSSKHSNRKNNEQQHHGDGGGGRKEAWMPAEDQHRHQEEEEEDAAVMEGEEEEDEHYQEEEEPQVEVMRLGRACVPSPHEWRTIRHLLRASRPKLEAFFLYYSDTVGGDLEAGEDLLLRRRMSESQLVSFCRHLCLCPGLLPRQDVLSAYTHLCSIPDFHHHHDIRASVPTTTTTTAVDRHETSTTSTARLLRRRQRTPSSSPSDRRHSRNTTSSTGSFGFDDGHARGAVSGADTSEAVVVEEEEEVMDDDNKQEEEKSLGFREFREWLAMMAVECEWFRRQDGQADAPTRVSRFVHWLDTAPSSDKVYAWAYKHRKDRPGAAVPRGGLRANSNLISLADLA